MLRVSWLYRQKEVKAAGLKLRPEEVMYSRWDAQTPLLSKYLATADVESLTLHAQVVSQAFRRCGRAHRDASLPGARRNTEHCSVRVQHESWVLGAKLQLAHVLDLTIAPRPSSRSIGTVQVMFLPEGSQIPTVVMGERDEDLHERPVPGFLCCKVRL